MNQHARQRPPLLAIVLVILAVAVIAAAAVLAVGGRSEPTEAVVQLPSDITLVPATTTPPDPEVPSEAELLNATVPYRCFGGRNQWLTLVNGRADGPEGIGGVFVTSTTSGDLDGDGSLEVVIAMRESCGGESIAPTVVVKSAAELNERRAIATLGPSQLRPIGEVLEMEVLPAYRLEVRGQVNEFRITGGTLDTFTGPTPPRQFLFDNGAFQVIGIP